MPLDIVICVKQVPHPDYLGKMALDPTSTTIDREAVPAIINPTDRNALEEALRIRERFSGRVVVATAQALAYGIRKLERFDLILCGDATIDSGTGQVAVQLAEFLDLPCITNAEELTFENEQSVLVKRMWEGGYIKARIRLPAVIAVTSKVNQPRLPSVSGIMAVTQKEIKHWNATDISADTSRVGLSGSPTQVFQMSEFHARRQGELLQGSSEEVVTLAIDRLAKLEMV